MPKKKNPEQGGGVRGVDLAEVERLLAFMGKHELEEFEYERAGVHIRLKKASARPGAHRSTSAVASGIAEAELHEATQAPRAASSHPTRASAKRPSDATSVGTDVHIVKSPIVGTFYAAPGPEASPFVTLGAKVDVGSVLCIIEAMKLMNEIESDAAGEIVSILAENGKPVEYGEPLFGIRPESKK
ncbi:MAG TPA: acetyl-CoA carboxylase biotin carboxyl carrier protein [Candidatus Acidoferrales bacterium]|nr:acetyl-CoA carboxylase biotin carboxyl carrier protein [Candidatus Acidoferrales bacterium]